MSAAAQLNFVGIVNKVGPQEAQVLIYPEFCAGLKGIEDYSHIIILYWHHLRDDAENRQTLLVFPRRHAAQEEKGVFACRSPSRPNPIGLCVVELLKVDDCVLTVRGLDAFEKSPVIDIKPYIPRADSFPKAHAPKWTEQGPST
jgi:tRNA-Thr(GGU) m(6)t(6)A37 methyltransferase TsaA